MTPPHIFGPVASRRLGRSLGIDLIPFKTCSFDCVYCECGATTRLSVSREEFFPPAGIRESLDQALKENPALDYITFAGSGEPNLSRSVREIISFLREGYPAYRIALLTNGSLCSDPDVIEDIRGADLIIPTLSSAFQETYEAIHRPHPSLTVESHIEGLKALRRAFSGRIWLEVFLVPPLNTTPEELLALREVIHGIRPDRIQLNMLDRPGTEGWVTPLQPEEGSRIEAFFAGTGIPVDLIAISPCQAAPERKGLPRTMILQTLMRRPCTRDDIAVMTGLHPNEVMKIIAGLLAEEEITTRRGERGIFYLRNREEEPGADQQELSG